MAIGDGNVVKLLPTDPWPIREDPGNLLERTQGAAGARLDGFYMVIGE